MPASSRLLFGLGLLALCAAGGGIWMSKEHLWRTGTKGPSPAGETSPASYAPADANAPRRRAPELLAQIRKLEEFEREWEKSAPPSVNPRKIEKDWNEAGFRFLDRLTTDQITALARLFHDPDADLSEEIIAFGKPLHIIWGARDPEGARRFMTQIAMNLKNKESGLAGMNPLLEEISDDFHHVRVGQAYADPKEAWEGFQRDAADPAMEPFVSPEVTLPEIFRLYAAKNPAEAWSLAMNAADADTASRILDGFVAGAPDGTDWASRADELSRSDWADELKKSFIAGTIGIGWFAQDPKAAVAWLTGQFSYEDLAAGKFSFTGNDEPPPSSDEAKKLATEKWLMESGLNNFPDTSDQVAKGLSQMLATGETQDREFVVRFLCDPDLAFAVNGDPNFFGLIAKLPDAADRGKAFLAFARSITPRGQNDFGIPLPPDDPNPFVETLRKLAPSLNLSEPALQEAEQALSEVERKEGDALRKRAEKQGGNGGNGWSR